MSIARSTLPIWRTLALKDWRETRVRFAIGVAATVTLSAVFTLAHGWIIVQWRDEMVAHPEWRHPIWFEQVFTSYPHFVWHYLYQDMLQKVFVVAGVLLGLGGLARERVRGTAAFVLSMPVGRGTLLSVRALVASGEIIALAGISALTVVLCSLVTHEPYPVTHAIVHGLLLAAGALVVLATSLWVSALTESDSAPLLVGLAAAGVLFYWTGPYLNGAPPTATSGTMHLVGLMAGGAGASRADIPWAGLALYGAVAVAVLAHAFRRSIARDY
jgi:hypothetical protein